MAAWHGGGGYTSRSGLSARPGAADQVQIQIGDKFDFDEEVAGLSQGVDRLKGMAKAIDEARQEQGAIIDTLDDTIERARAGLQRVSKRLGAAYRQAQSWHLLWLVLFALVVFSALYVLSKTRSLLH